MNIHNLEKIFQPRSIGVIGADNREGQVGFALVNNLLNSGYTGNIYPITPSCNTVCGLPAFSSVSLLDSPPDLILVSSTVNDIPGIIKECSRMKVGGMIIVSAGGRISMEKCGDLKKIIKEYARNSGIRIIGPDSVGIISGQSDLNAGLSSNMPLKGRTAFISQSGSVFSSVLDISLRKKMGFSYFVSLGSMADVDFGDVIDYLGGDSSVGSILLYIEHLNRFRNFMSAARSVSRVKPIIAMKAGRTPSGAAASASRTGVTSGEDAVYDAAFRRAGIVRVKTFEELFDCAELLTKQSAPMINAGLAIISNAAGPGIVAADTLWDYGIKPVSFSADTMEKLEKILPPGLIHTNPIDLPADASPGHYQKAIEICINAPEVNGILVILTPNFLSRPGDAARVIADYLKDNKFPVFTSWMGGPDVEAGRKIFNHAGILTFDTPEQAVRAFMNIHNHAQNIKLLQEIPPKLPKKLHFKTQEAGDIIKKGIEQKMNFLTEIDSKSLLSAYGIPVIQAELVTTGEAAWKKANKMGFPVALKIYSPDITYKSDAKGVKLDLQTEFEVYKAFNDIMENARIHNPDARIEGAAIQPMLEHMDYELVIGAKKDPDFGPVIIFGMGGVISDVLDDRAIALPPLNRLLARRLMEGTRIYRMLQGFRNYPPADINLLEEILIRLSQLLIDFPEIEELDINPLMVKQDRMYAADARIKIRPSKVPSPFHLVISSYPNQHEDHIVINNELKLFLRPIRPEDAPLLSEMFQTMSPRSVYFRFFTPMKSLHHDVLARFTQIDYDREIALVAIDESNDREKMLGVGRIIMERNGKKGEFAVIISDDRQGIGIGAELLGRCLDIAKTRGIQKVWGLVLPENKNMLALGRKLGFDIKKDTESGDYILTMDFQKLP